MRRGSRRDAAHLFLPTVSICLSAEARWTPARTRARRCHRPKKLCRRGGAGTREGRRRLPVYGQGSENVTFRLKYPVRRGRRGTDTVGAMVGSAPWQCIKMVLTAALTCGRASLQIPRARRPALWHVPLVVARTAAQAHEALWLQCPRADRWLAAGFTVRFEPTRLAAGRFRGTEVGSLWKRQHRHTG
jgi:hypothetical protein